MPTEEVTNTPQVDVPLHLCVIVEENLQKGSSNSKLGGGGPKMTVTEKLLEILSPSRNLHNPVRPRYFMR